MVFNADTAGEEMREYLDLCSFVMSDASPHCQGLLLRGSSQFNERAIKLLAEHGEDYDLATLHILFPTQMLV